LHRETIFSRLRSDGPGLLPLTVFFLSVAVSIAAFIYSKNLEVGQKHTAFYQLARIQSDAIERQITQLISPLQNRKSSLHVDQIQIAVEEAISRRIVGNSNLAYYFVEATKLSDEPAPIPIWARQIVKTKQYNAPNLVTQIEVIDRIWTLTLAPKPGSYFLQLSWSTIAVLILGITIAALLSMCVYIVERHTRSTEKTVQKRIAKLQSVNQHLVSTQVKLKKLAQYDSLTGAPNRRLFRNELKRTLNNAQRKNLSAVVMFIDLNRFKAINDTYGHKAGDEVLRKTVLRMNSLVRGGDLVARIGGDEFAIMLNLQSNMFNAVILAERLGSALSRPISVKGQRVRVGLSIGIAMYPNHGKHPDTLLEAADRAMYMAKRNGKLFAISDDCLRDIPFATCTNAVVSSSQNRNGIQASGFRIKGSVLINR